MAAFEDIFSEAQTEMVALALDYAAHTVSNIYIQFSIRGNMYGAHVFFATDNKVVTLQYLPVPGQSPARRSSLLAQITDEARKIRSACQQFDRPIPVEGYLHHRATTGSLDARYMYDLDPFDEDGLIHESRRFEEWKQAVQAELDSARTA